MNVTASTQISAAASSQGHLKRWASSSRRCAPAGSARKVGRYTNITQAVAAVSNGVAKTVAKTAAPVKAPEVPKPVVRTEQEQLSDRHAMVASHFPTALGVDDFISRVEIALCGYGFTADNSIAMTNLCRDEVTAVLKDSIEAVFGSSFNTNGLGAVLTCGVTGIGAGLSHSPICSDDGRERYVFFTFPHIAIDAEGNVGSISRPGRPGKSCACGALNKALIELKAEGVAKGCKVPGVHDPLDPEYTILKQRLARRVRYEELDPQAMTLADMTAVAERTITDDLEYLIEKAVDIKKADYAVVAGVQIHNWGTQFDDTDEPAMEFVAPTKVYACVNGEKTFLDLATIPSLTPRMISLLAQHSQAAHTHARPDHLSSVSETGTSSSTLHQIPYNYLANRLGAGTAPEPKRTTRNGPIMAAAPAGMKGQSASRKAERDAAAPTMDSTDEDTTEASRLVAAEEALEQAQLLLSSAVQKVAGAAKPSKPAAPAKTSFKPTESKEPQADK